MRATLLALALLCVTLLIGLNVGRASAEPLTKATVDNVASATWSGGGVSFGVSSNNLAGNTAASIGDVNGDGTDDSAVTINGFGIAVLFTPPSGLNGGISVTALKPSQGYLVQLPDVGGLVSVSGIGDQNGDGVPDVAFGQSTDRVTVVYGIADPSSLPACPSGTSKCLDTSIMPLSAGYVLTGPSGSGLGQSIAALGNFRGTSSGDFAIGAYTADGYTGKVYVISDSLDPASSPFDITTADPADVMVINASQAGGTLGTMVNHLGDLNGDGFADMYVNESALAGSDPALGYVIYGGDDLSNPMDLSSFDSDAGFTLSPPILGVASATNAGDVNGDGLSDLAVGGFGLTSTTGSGAILYGPNSAPTGPISMAAPTSDEGYAVVPGDPGGQFGTPVQNVGDFNGDGVPDQLFSSPLTEVGANGSAGAVTLVFGQRPAPAAPLALGPDLTPDLGVAVVGDGANDRLGNGLASLGDVDHDGLTDFLVVSSGSGRAYLVMGSSLIGQAKTGQAGSVGTEDATLGGFAVTNGRDGTAYFEYGTSNNYGSQTTAQTVDGSASVDADVSGLDADTMYHYRLVVENDLGLKSFGADRTFTTAPEPVDPCEQDSTQPGCPDFDGKAFCEANPNDELCQVASNPDKFCEANPTAEICKPKAAGLSGLIANSSAKKVRRGKKAVVWAWITSTGTKSADGVKVCAKAPKRKAKIVGKRCRMVGGLAPGKTAKVQFKVKAKAHKGAKVNVKLVASAPGVSNKTAKVKFTVR